MNITALMPSVLTLGDTGSNIASYAGLPSLFGILCDSWALKETDVAYMVMFIVGAVLCMVSAYLIGSFNPAISFSKMIYHEDIRSYGSGNAGTTNTLRTYGKKMAVLIFGVDLLKAALAVILGSFLMTREFGGAIAALFVVLGHMFPVYYRFKGGKGVACAAMCIFLLSPISFLILLALFIFIVACFRYISLGSVMCAMLFPFLNYAFYPLNAWVTISAFCIGGLIVFMHRENIKRLMEGKESKFSLKKTDKHAASAHNGNENGQLADLKVEENSGAVKEEKEYKDSDFVKCSCGRVIPKSRKKCVYCGALNKNNPTYRAEQSYGKKKKKKKK